MKANRLRGDKGSVVFWLSGKAAVWSHSGR